MKKFACALALLAPLGAAHAQRESNVTGVTLMKACTGTTFAACDAYVDGFTDAILQEGRKAAIACVPRAATGTELRDVVVAYLRANPQVQHDKAGQIARLALAKAYPCKG